jgi:hypothetical protein
MAIFGRMPTIWQWIFMIEQVEMTPDEALKLYRNGEPLYRAITLREVATFEADEHYASRGTKVVMFSLPATNPGHEHGGYSKEYHEEALAASREGKMTWKVL